MSWYLTLQTTAFLTTQIAKFMWPKWDPPGCCRPQMGPMLAPWTLLSGNSLFGLATQKHIIRALLALCEESIGDSQNAIYAERVSLWRHQMETVSALLAICAGNPPVPGEYPTQRRVKRSFDVSFDLRLIKRLRKQSWCWWFETLSRPLWRHCNVQVMTSSYIGYQ